MLEALVDGSITDQQVIEALNEARRRRRAVEIIKAQDSLNFGQRVRVEGIRPKILNGSIGKIVEFNRNRTRADIEVESSLNFKYTKGSIMRGLPVLTLKPADIEKPKKGGAR